MSHLTLHIRALRAIREVQWSPSGVNVLLGPNGAGKTTIFLALKLVRVALARGLPEAVSMVLGGTRDLRHWDAFEDEPTEIGIDFEDLRWRVQLLPRGKTVDYLTDETLYEDDTCVFRKDALGKFQLGALDLQGEANERLGLRALRDMRPALQPDHGAAMDAVGRMAGFIDKLLVFHDPDLWNLRIGSDSRLNRHLHSRSTNAVTMLRSWRMKPADAERFAFVLDGLRAAFPGLVADIGFDEGGETLSAEIYRPSHEAPVPLARQANGVVALLALLCDLAAADEGGVIAIDEPENALHPFALRAFLRAAERWASRRNVTILLATHAPAILDHFGQAPERVYVLRAGDRPAPVRLDTLRNPEWLDDFRLGEFLMDGELGSNDD